MVGVSLIPHWLEILLRDKFFNPCIIHEFAKKNEKNIFCLDCSISICPHCVPSHRSHRLLQIRRYVYHDVIRLSDAQKLMNCSLVQPYTTNSAKVVFLNQRPMSRPFRGSGNFCITCDRSLQDPYFFCSLSCKVHQQLMTKNSSGNREFLPILPDKARIESLSVSENEEDGQMTPDSVLDSHVSLSGSRSTASASGCVGGSVSVVSCKTLACTANLEFVKKKRSSLNSVPRVSCQPRYSPAAEIAVAFNRRKSVPHRSPLN
ncbi:protein RGF1 INDUCIBLE TRANSCRIPTION FACTOR 1-like [Fagus crenata]